VSATKLDPIVAAVRARAAQRRVKTPLEQLERLVLADPARRDHFVGALRRAKFGFIAELKRRSPSAGALLDGAGFSWIELAQAYRDGGASALSVLTEQDHFDGALGDLELARTIGLPRLRKDFVLDAGMVFESALAGADAVLLIAAILAPHELDQLRRCARDLGLAVLVEVHDERELDLALSLEPELVGVNARDLTTLAVDIATVERLMPRVPTDVVRVAESGIKSLADLQRVRAAGASCALIGETLVRARDPAAVLRGWKAALDV
jgi:indole-3-glycerol phosphate synthase